MSERIVSVMKALPSRWLDAIYYGLYVVALIVYLAWPLSHLDIYAWSNDEGLYVQRAALANQGYALYTDVAFNKPPLFIWILQLGFYLLGPTIAAARLVVLGMTLLGVIALGGIVTQLWGRWAALAAVWLWVGIPEVIVRAHVVMSDLPAVALALASLWLALRYSCEGGAIFLVFSGFMYAAALLIHPLLAYFGLPIAVALVGPPPQFLPLQESPKLKHRAKRTKPCGLNSAPRDATKLLDMGPGRWSLLLFAAVVGGCVLLALAFVDQRAFLDWVVGSNYSALDTEVTILEQDNWALVLEYLCQNCILLGMAVLGAVVTWAFGRTSRGAHTCGASARWVVAVWLFATLLTLLLWSPLWEHYLLFLALPLVALAGVGFAMGGKLLLSKSSQLSLPVSGTSLLSLWPRVGLSALLLGGGCLFLVDRIRTPLPQSAGGLAWSGERMAARAFLAASAPRGGFVMTDDPFLAFAEGYLVPPALTEASYKQFRTGRLTVEDLIVSALRYKAQAVLIASGRFDLVPAFERWASLVASERQIFGDICTYWWEPPVAAPHVVMEHLKREGGGDALAFVNPVPLDDLWEVPPLSVEAGMTLGDDIILLGAVLEPTVGGLKPGQPFTVTLVWRAEGWIDQSYHVFLHLLDADGVLVTQSDGLPARGTQPTLAWLPGEVVLDQRVLTLPEAVPGIYTLQAGLYTLGGGRLSTDAGVDAVPLTDMIVSDE